MTETAAAAAVASFVRSVDVRPTGDDAFEAAANPGDGADERIFGGQTLAQAVVAAGRTAGGYDIQSMHAYFLRAGRPEEPLSYTVRRIRDGRAFAGRLVEAKQGDSLIFEALVSFVRPEEGLHHQVSMPGHRPPSEDAVLAQRQESVRRWGGVWAFDSMQESTGAEALPHQAMWWRTAAPLPDESLLHAAAMAWVSDNMLHATVFEHYGLPAGVTLDHSIWWHEAPKFEGWLLRTSHSPAAHSARALILGSMFTAEGRLVASIAQEGLFRKEW